MSVGLNSIDAVKRRIKDLQGQADEANERAERLQKDLDMEQKTREEVGLTAAHLYRPVGTCGGVGGGGGWASQGEVTPQVPSEKTHNLSGNGC